MYDVTSLGYTIPMFSAQGLNLPSENFEYWHFTSIKDLQVLLKTFQIYKIQLLELLRKMQLHEDINYADHVPPILNGIS